MNDWFAVAPWKEIQQYQLGGLQCSLDYSSAINPFSSITFASGNGYGTIQLKIKTFFNELRFDMYLIFQCWNNQRLYFVLNLLYKNITWRVFIGIHRSKCIFWGYSIWSFRIIRKLSYICWHVRLKRVYNYQWNVKIFIKFFNHHFTTLNSSLVTIVNKFLKNIRFVRKLFDSNTFRTSLCES